MGTSPDRRWLYRRLAVALIAATGAYAWYVTAQYERLNELNQRELGNAAAELKRTVENAVGTIDRFRPQADDQKALCRFDADQPYLEVVPDGSCQQATGWLVNARPTTDGGLGIVAAATHADATHTEATQPDTAVTFAFRTDTLLQELSFLESFGLIFIAREDGSVLYQDAPGRRQWLRHLRWGEQRFRDSGAARQGNLTLQQLNVIFGDDKASGWNKLRSMSGRTTLRLGGRFHEVYLEPLVIENGRTTSLVLGGAVPSEALVRQALAVDSYFLAALVFLLLIGVLGFPFVKLLSLDPRERFRLRDVTLLYLSTAALLALFTFATQGLDGYIRWHAVADDGLKQLAYRLERDFTREVAALRRQLADYDCIVSGEPAASVARRSPYTNWFELGGGGREAFRLEPPGPGLHLEQAAWIAPGGAQIWKTTSDSVAFKNDVSGRVYFRSVQDGNLFRLESEAEPFYVGPDRSISDGKFYTFVAIPSRLGSGAGSESASGGYVAAATARLVSLESVPLPAGYGFTLINREGRVLYHSDGRLSLRENLFEALSDGARARAMVYAGHEDSVSGRYRERPHELYFRPVPLQLAQEASLPRQIAGESSAAGLYIVSFRDTSIERAIVARVFVIAMLGPLMVILGLIGLSLLAVAVVPVRRRERWSVWLWPHGGLVSMHRRLSAALAVVFACGIVGGALGHGDVAFAFMPVVAVTVAVSIYAFSTRVPRARRGLSSSGWYMAMFLLFLTCTIVAPASVLLRAAMGHEFGKLIATEREWMNAQRADLPRVIQADMRAEHHPAAMATAFANARIEALAATPDPGPFDTVPPAAPASARWLLAPFHWVDDMLPIENDYSARQWYEDQELSYSPPGTLVTGIRISGWGLIGLVATFALLAGWIRWNAKHLFFSDEEVYDPAGTSFDGLWDQCTNDERLVLIQIIRDHVANPHQRPVIRGLIKRGLLTLDPDLRPFSLAFEGYVLQRGDDLQADLRTWEAVESRHSWRYMRLVLLVSIGGLAFFLIATQPGLQSGLLGIATGISGVLTTSLKLRDAVASWLGDRKTAV